LSDSVSREQPRATWTRLDDVRSKDGTRLALFRRDPAGTPKGDVVLIGGLADHMGRYEHVATALAGAGWRVTGADLRGNGHADGRRGHVARWSDFVDDLDAVVKTLPGAPFVVAHSTGGLVVLDWLRDHDCQGVVLTAPLLRNKLQPARWKVLLAGLLSRIAPGLALANEIPASWLTHSQDVVAAYEKDPLVYKTATPRWFTEMLAAGRRVLEHAPRYRTPALVMWGTDEKIVSPEGIGELVSAWGSGATSKAWPGLYHEILNEPERDQVIADITAWLDAQGAARGEVA
jgi:alpha-beta hydrolase superfamily lysophospholipase